MRVEEDSRVPCPEKILKETRAMGQENVCESARTLYEARGPAEINRVLSAAEKEALAPSFPARVARKLEKRSLRPFSAPTKSFSKMRKVRRICGRAKGARGGGSLQECSKKAL